MIRRFLLLLLPFTFLLLPTAANAENLFFSADDRVLIIAPHPDDEALGCAGIIQAALEAGAEVNIVYLTHGESNEMSALFYQKKPMLVKTDFVKVGRLRKKEAAEAMAVLGVPEKNLIFFGYPDMGTMPMWEKFWNSKKPFRSFLARINKVIHDNDFSYGKYYRGFNVLHDFEKVLLRERPTHIFVTAPFDLNLDHQAAYLFMKAALLNVGDSLAGDPPAVYLYTVHEHDWPKPRKYAPELSLTPPPSEKEDVPVNWESFSLSTAQVKRKEKSLLSYESQLSYSKNFLLSFVRKNEVVAREPHEDLVVVSGSSADTWISDTAAGAGKQVRYAANDKELFIDVPITYALDEMGTFSTNVFGYKKGVPFTAMPKLNLRLFAKQLLIKDGFKPIVDPRILFKTEKGRLFVRVPLAALKDPDTIFVSTRTAKNRMAFDFGSWRVIQIKKSS